MYFNLILLSLILMTLNVVAGSTTIQPWSENQFYWSYQNKPVLLLGGSDDDNLFQWHEKELIAQLDRLKNAGGNVIRNTMSDRKDKGIEVYPFQKLKNGKYDLNKWNKEYWDRFERLLRETSKRDIIIQIEIWDRFDYTDNRGKNRWQIHPYNPKNNINYTYKQSGFAKNYPDHPGANRQPFFFTTPKQRNNTVVLKYQQKFVDKMLDYTLKYDNVLYCIDNETSAQPEWGQYWAKYIKKRAAKEGKKINVTEMWDSWNLRSKEHKQTFDHPELYDFVDVSQNNHKKGQVHWDNFLYVKKYLSKNPRPINTIKTYGATGYRFGYTDQDGLERFWRHLLAGDAAIRFHRPKAGLGLTDKAVAAIQAARKLESIIPLWSVEPANELLSDRKPNEAYLATNKKRSAYALYFPAGGEITIDLSSAKGELTLRWININTGKWGPVKKIKGGGKIKIKSPGKENWAATIVSNNKPSSLKKDKN